MAAVYNAGLVRPYPLLAASFILLTACGGGDDPIYGAPCDAMNECAGELSCVVNSDFVDGYCTSTCDPGECGEGAVCDPSTSPSLCLAGCAVGDECRSGYQCWRSACRPRCTGDTDCGGAGATCESGRCEGAECATDPDCGPSQICSGGRCVDPPPMRDAGDVRAPAGTPCTRDDECQDDVCLPAALGGVCSLPCARAEDCFVFPAEAGCSALPEAGAPTVCVLSPAGADTIGASCTSDDDCLARICQDGQCSEVCSAESECEVGMRCLDLERAGAGGATFRGCGYRPLAGSVVVEQVDYGSFDIPAGSARTQTLATPPDAVSVTFQVQQVGGDSRDLSFLFVRDPAGTMIFDANEIFMLHDQPIRWLPAATYDSATMLVPNTTPDRVSFVSGIHQWAAGPIPAGAGDSASARLRLTALVKRAPGGVVTGGQLDLNVHIVGISGLSASTAGADTRLQSALSRINSILLQAGISLGAVNYFDVTGSDASRLQVIDSTDTIDSELADLFRLSAARSDDALNVFLVRSISGADGGFHALGIAGGIPGAAALRGTAHSGVVASFDSAIIGGGASGGQLAGQILAHEISHYLGLFHSTEQARPCGPGETPADGCAPFSGGDTLADTSRGDTRNLMYWSVVGSGSNTRLSAGQGHVLRMSALVR